jgi:hypothetical protein
LAVFDFDFVQALESVEARPVFEGGLATTGQDVVALVSVGLEPLQGAAGLDLEQEGMPDPQGYPFLPRDFLRSVRGIEIQGFAYQRGRRKSFWA